MSFDSTRGCIYQKIAGWPFAFFLTTNYDDALKCFLSDANIPVITRLNTLDDFRTLRADSENTIYKIHGDTSDPENIVLTSDQYNSFRYDPKRKYWREKISSVLHMVDVVIIGYSLSDPDFNDQLERAKLIAQPDKPIYMFASGFSREQINELLFQYSIKIIPYKIINESHTNLQKIFKRYDPFIAKRNSSNIGLDEIDINEAELASSIYLFTQLRLLDKEISVIGNAYAAIILKILSEVPNGKLLTKQDIYKELKNKTHSATHPDPKGFDLALEELYKRSFIRIPSEGKYCIESNGKDRLTLALAERQNIKDKFIASCKLILKSDYEKLNDKEIERVINKLEIGIVNAFRNRGLEIARVVFSNHQIDPSDSHDILEIINSSGSDFNSQELASAYSDLMIEALLNPSDEIKKYLALMSQGYFAFHALGLDDQGNEKRLDIARKKTWIIDSSILIPLLAKDSPHYDYSCDLINRAKELGLNLKTTTKLITEVVGHADWAYQTFKDRPINEITPSLILASTGKAGFSENLFIAGFLKWFQNNPTPSLEEYFKDCFGPEFSTDLSNEIIARLESLGIEVIEFDKVDGFSDNFYYLRDSKYCSEIINLRQKFGTFTGEEQCIAEAEVLVLSDVSNAQFLSLSTILDRIANKRITWTPDDFFRFLSLFSKNILDPKLFYDSLTQEFFSSGINIIDSETITKFASPGIKQARMELEKAENDYVEALGRQRYEELKEEFERTPDLEKQFFSIQIAHLVARKERDKRLQAEKQSVNITQKKGLSEEERLDYEKLKGKKKQKAREREKKKRRKKSIKK